MNNKKEILGIIPARGSSKGIKGKNLYMLSGKPLIQYTFEAAKKSKYISRIILTSDDSKIVEFAKEHNIEVPFIRPNDLASDVTPMISVIKHAVEWLKINEEYQADIIVLLQPTSPLSKASHIDEAVEILLSHDKADSVVSVVKVPHNFNPVSVMCMNNDKELSTYIPDEGTKILRRQDKPTVYARNGAAVYVFRKDTVYRYGNIFGKKCLGYEMSREESIDIDEEIDIKFCEALINLNTNKL